MGPLTFTLVFGLIAGIVFGLFKGHKDDKRKRKSRQIRQKLRSEKRQREESQLMDLTLKHFDTLNVNRDKAVYTDEYGTEIYDKWEKEL